MRRRLLLLAGLALLLSAPAAAEEPPQERSCEEICAELAAQNCEKIDSMACNYYIMGCHSGCAFARKIKQR